MKKNIIILYIISIIKVYCLNFDLEIGTDNNFNFYNDNILLKNISDRYYMNFKLRLNEYIYINYKNTYSNKIDYNFSKIEKLLYQYYTNYLSINLKLNKNNKLYFNNSFKIGINNENSSNNSSLGYIFTNNLFMNSLSIRIIYNLNNCNVFTTQIKNVYQIKNKYGINYFLVELTLNNQNQYLLKSYNFTYKYLIKFNKIFEKINIDDE